MWRLALAPLFIGYLSLFAEFRFALHIPNAPFVEYARNYLMLFACIAGFIMALFASPGRRALLGAGLILMLAPIWLPFQTRVGSLGEIALAEIADARALSLISRASAALWGLMMVRGPRGRDWEKSLLALALIARAGAMVVWRNEYLDWFDDTMLCSCAILAGALADCAYRGPCPPDLFVPLIAGGWLLVCFMYPAFNIVYLVAAGAVSALIGITALICMRPAKRMYAGYILALVGCLANCAAILIKEGVLL